MWQHIFINAWTIERLTKLEKKSIVLNKSKRYTVLMFDINIMIILK